MTKVDFQEIFDAVQMDENAKKAFLVMSREEQLLAILGMQAWTRSELVVIKKDILDVRNDLDDGLRETRKYRYDRERKEELHNGDAVNTTQKILTAIREAEAKRFDWGVWFRDRILPVLVTGFILALLYVVYGGRLPTP